MELTPARIAGDRVSGRSTFEVRSPYDGRTIGVVPLCEEEEAHLACDAASSVLERQLPCQDERAAILTRAAHTLSGQVDRFAHLIALEAGKPVKQARIEVQRAIDTLLLSSVEARKLGGDVVPMGATASGRGRIGLALRVPIGVVVAITPFNFPLNLVAHKIGPAIAAGCPIVLKPSPRAPLSGIELVELLLAAGLPPRFISVLTDVEGEAAKPLVRNPIPRLITFTGSAKVGWEIAAAAPRKKVCLELGSNAPLIVESDADLDAFSAAIGAAAFGYSGQSCISVQRVICHRSIEEKVRDRLVDAARGCVLGDPLDERTDVGPLISPNENTRVGDWVEEAVRRGARVLTGGKVVEGIFQPTVVDAIPTDVRLWREEVFAPVVAIHPYDHFDEAVKLANDTRYPLQVGIFTRDIGRALDAVQRLRFGGVLVNDVPTYRADQQPYGGNEDAGNTREGPSYAVKEMSEVRFVSLRS